MDPFQSEESVMKLVSIGYWAGEKDDRWPDVRDLVDPDWDADDRADCIAYLRRGLVAHAYFGPSVCRICHQPNGSVDLTDLVYIWPEGLAHYLLEHSVRLPDEFVDHVRARRELMDDLVVEDDWWISHRSKSTSRNEPIETIKSDNHS